MSIVTNVVCRFGSWIAYDGRARKDGTIISENVDKAKKINDFVYVGYTGILELAEAVIEHITSSISQDAITELKSNHVAQAISQILAKSNYPKELYAQFVCTGKNSTGQMASYTIERNGDVSELIPSESYPICCSVLYTGKFKAELEDYIFQQINQNGFSNLSIVNGMTQYIHDASILDDTVNDNVKVIELRF